MWVLVEPDFSGALPDFGIRYIRTMAGCRHATGNTMRLNVGVRIRCRAIACGNFDVKQQDSEYKSKLGKRSHGEVSSAKNGWISFSVMEALGADLTADGNDFGGSLWYR